MIKATYEKTDERVRFVNVKYTFYQRVRMYLRNIWYAVTEKPEKTWSKTIYMKPGDEGYEESPFGVTMMRLGNYKLNEDGKVESND